MRYFPICAILFAVAHFALPAATFEWSGSIQPTQTIEIRNVNGDLKAEPSPDPDLHITVEITGTHPDPATVRIDVVPHDGGVLVCTIYIGMSQPEFCTPARSPSLTLSNSDVNVLYLVRVPAGVKLLARTVNGAVTAALPESPVSLETVNGRIVLATNRPADARAVNGSILATLGAVDRADSHEMVTVNGAIDLELPDTAAVTLRASVTFGPILTDLPLTVHRSWIGSWLYDHLNGGGPLLFLNTVNGSIHLRRAPAQ